MALGGNILGFGYLGQGWAGLAGAPSSRVGAFSALLGLSPGGLLYPSTAVYTDVTEYVDGPIRITVGSDNLLGAVQAATCDFTLKNALDPAYWNPANPASTPNLSAPGFRELRPVLIQQTDPVSGAVYSIYFGYLSDAQYDAQTRETTVHCEDLLLYLDRVYPTIAATGATTTGAAIGLVLDAAGWTNAAYRQLSTGDTIPDFSANASESALALIVGLVQAELGTVYIDRQGVFRYASRDVPELAAPRASFAREPLDLGTGLDLHRIFNKYTVQKTGGVAQTASDAVSIAAYGTGVGPGITSPYLQDDTAALNLASELVYENKDQPVPVTFHIDNETPAVFVEQLLLGLLDAVTLAEPVSLTSGIFNIHRITHEISVQGAYMATDYLLRRQIAGGWVLDSSTLDGPDVLRY